MMHYHLNHDMRRFSTKLKGLDYKDGHAILNQSVRALGENIPPLVNAYMNLSSTMKTFGTCLNHEFGGVEETGTRLPFPTFTPAKKNAILIHTLSGRKN